MKITNENELGWILDENYMLKPISFLQRRFIVANAQHLGLTQKPRTTDADLEQLVREKGRIEVVHPHHLPFSLGIMADGKLGVQITYRPPFTDALQEKLPDEEFDNLVENGFALHKFENGRELVFSLAFECSRRGVVFGLPFGLALDVFDFREQPKLIGTFMAQVNSQSGIMADEFAENLDIYSLFEKYLKSIGIEGWRFLNDIYPRRIELAKIEFTPVGPIFINFSVEPGYRHNGEEGFSGISQILASTAIRLTAEQFFCRAYASEVRGGGLKFTERYLKPRQLVQVGQIKGLAFPFTN